MQTTHIISYHIISYHSIVLLLQNPCVLLNDEIANVP